MRSMAAGTDSQVQGTALLWEAWQQELEAAGQAASTVRMQSDVNAGAWLALSLWSPHN